MLPNSEITVKVAVRSFRLYDLLKHTFQFWISTRFTRDSYFNQVTVELTGKTAPK